MQLSTKQLWTALNSLPSRNTPPCLPNCHSTAQLAAAFMDFFTDKISKLCSSLNPVDNHFSSPHSSPSSIPPIITSFAPATLDEVRRAIISSSNATCPLDPIPTHLLKSCLDSLILPITNIINLSLSNGIFPDTFKSAIVTPLRKNILFLTMNCPATDQFPISISFQKFSNASYILACPTIYNLFHLCVLFKVLIAHSILLKLLYFAFTMIFFSPSTNNKFLPSFFLTFLLPLILSTIKFCLRG